jgi:hypothetical protein
VSCGGPNIERSPFGYLKIERTWKTALSAKPNWQTREGNTPKARHRKKIPKAPPLPRGGYRKEGAHRAENRPPQSGAAVENRGYKKMMAREYACA